MFPDGLLSGIVKAGRTEVYLAGGGEERGRIANRDPLSHNH